MISLPFTSTAQGDKNGLSLKASVMASALPNSSLDFAIDKLAPKEN